MTRPAGTPTYCPACGVHPSGRPSCADYSVARIIDATPLHIITSAGADATATIEDGRHGGLVLAIRDASGAVLLATKIQHCQPMVLGSILDPGTVTTVLDELVAPTRSILGMDA